MSDWSEPFEARLRYMDVDPVSWRETGPVAGVLAGGSITHDADDPIKTSASISTRSFHREPKSLSAWAPLGPRCPPGSALTRARPAGLTYMAA